MKAKKLTERHYNSCVLSSNYSTREGDNVIVTIAGHTGYDGDFKHEFTLLLLRLISLGFQIKILLILV